MKKPFLIGLLGSTYSGKSTVGRFLKKTKIDFIESDKIVHQLYLPEKRGWQKIKKMYGQRFFDQQQRLNRKKMGEYLFSHPAELKKIETIIHPLVFQEIRQKIKKSPAKIIAIELIKLPPENSGIIFAKLLLIKRSKKNILSQVKSKKEEKYISEILRQQKFTGQFDFIINNNQDLDTLQKAVQKITIKLRS